MAKKKETLLKKRTEQLSSILNDADFIKGTLTKVSRKDVETVCYHLTYKDKKQKTHTKYVSEEQIRDVQNKINKMGKIKKNYRCCL